MQHSNLKIGQYALPSRFTLAPMAGITDVPFRRLCRQFGAGMTTSEMTTADITLWQTTKSRQRLELDFDEEPRVVQIAGSEPDRMAIAAKLCVDRGAQIIDINMGCPAKKVCRRAAGSALLRNPALVSQILAAVVASVTVPVTLKIRTGWDKESKNALEIARIAEDIGIQALAVHGRTRACKYKGGAEHETVAQIKDNVSIPILANGDLGNPEKSLEVLHLSSVDGLMIGRSARGRPWVFHELNYFYENGTLSPPLDKNKVRDIMLAHLEHLYRFYGNETGVRVARKHLTWYCAGLKNTEEFRSQVVRVDNASEQIGLTRNFLGKYVKDEILAA
ncbi:MAG: tRNA dihydrouridine synthase DusB [Woeseia sp.]|nr:tRNA dihydrouridine synthase DusB [Woeseia sp.]|tara:strand:+ start:2482 stop:3483 length:1002 start_codon:yes stop_codon:yes gene_type:complete